MTVQLLGAGPTHWESSRDDEGHREYIVRHQVLSGVLDGPANVMQCPGLPVVGSTWAFGSDIDIWAHCYPYMKVSRAPEIKEGHPGKIWHVEQKFSTKPITRCQDTPIEDPLLEPMKISGSFVKYTREVQQNNDGSYIKSSSHELIRGPVVEYDSNRPTVRIEQNVPDLQLATITGLIDGLNDAPLWGCARRCVKLSAISWERKYYGVCHAYYTRSFDFDIDFRTFDRIAQDEGTKVLRGQWFDGPSPGTAPDDWVLLNIGGARPNKNNPTHFIRFKDRHGENCRVVLDGKGLPAVTGVYRGTGAGTGSASLGGQAGAIPVYPLYSVNFLVLGLPTTL